MDRFFLIWKELSYREIFQCMKYGRKVSSPTKAPTYWFNFRISATLSLIDAVVIVLNQGCNFPFEQFRNVDDWKTSRLHEMGS